MKFKEEEYKFCNLGPFGFDEIYGEVKMQKQEIKEHESQAEETGRNKSEEINEDEEEFENVVETGKNGSIKIETLDLKIKNNQDDQLLIMTEKMYYKYPKIFIDAVLKSWLESYGNFKSENAQNLNRQQSKIIDLITFFNFPIQEFNKLITETEVFRENRVKNKHNKGVVMSYTSGAFECAVLAFYYGYLKYKVWVFIDDNTTRKQVLRVTWYAICEFLQEFTNSTHPQVDVWVINIYHLAAKKFPTQEIIGEYSIKKLIHVHENVVLEKIVGFICEDDRSKLPFEKAGESEFYAFVYPLPALVLDLSFQFGNTYLSKLTAHFEEDFHLRYYTKIIALKCLKTITMELLKMTYENKSNNRIAKRVRNIITKLFIYIESLLKNKLAINENLYVEIIEYLFIFLDDSRDFLMNAFENPIEKFFDSDLFFECPSKSLVLWSKIIYWQSNQANKKILTKYLYK